MVEEEQDTAPETSCQRIVSNQEAHSMNLCAKEQNDKETALISNQ
jgi:hypothetical protein